MRKTKTPKGKQVGGKGQTFQTNYQKGSGIKRGHPFRTGKKRVSVNQPKRVYESVVKPEEA